MGSSRESERTHWPGWDPAWSRTGIKGNADPFAMVRGCVQTSLSDRTAARFSSHCLTSTNPPP